MRTNAEGGFDRGAWLTLTAVLLFGLAVLGTTPFVLAMPGDGWQMVYEEPPLTQFLGDWPTALQAGDVVVAVEGTAIETIRVGRLAPPANWQAGETIAYTIERDGRQQTVDVLLGTLSPRGIVQAVANSMRADLLQSSWFVVGLIVFILRPRETAARLLLLAGGSLVLATKIGWAATTISALFTPLRRRVQDVIDRRFFRKKYDAQQVLAQFGQKARDETDMGVLTAELLRVVQETMQPDAIELWLQKNPARSSRAAWRGIAERSRGRTIG